MWETGETGEEIGKNVDKTVGLVAADPDNLETIREQGGKLKVLRKCTSRESVSPLWHLIRVLLIPIGRINASGIE